jgi:stress-induced morphogen
LKKENKLDRARALPDVAEAYESAVAQQAEATAKKAYDDAVKKTKDARLATAFRASVIATYKAGQTKIDMEKIVTGVLKEKLKTDPNQARSLVYALAK